MNKEKNIILDSIKDMTFEDKILLLYSIVDSSMTNIKIDKKKVVPMLEKVCLGVNGNKLINLSKNKIVMFVSSQIAEMNENEQNVLTYILFREVYEEMRT